MLRRTPLARRTRITPVNRERKAAALAAALGEQAARCRDSPCCVCRCGPCDPHHEPTRARGGLDRDTLPLCREHHDERHRIGRFAFETRHGLDLLAEAERMRGEPEACAPA